MTPYPHNSFSSTLIHSSTACHVLSFSQLQLVNKARDHRIIADKDKHYPPANSHLSIYLFIKPMQTNNDKMYILTLLLTNILISGRSE